jgi:plastocyanin
MVVAVLLLPPSLLTARAKVLHILLENVAFGEMPKDARVGDAVEWSNKDFVAHTATARDGSFDLELPPGKSARAVLKRPGAIAFYCRYHPAMTEEITVAP